MHILLRDGDTIVEIQAHDGQMPRICAWAVSTIGERTRRAGHRSTTFARGQYYEFDELLGAARKIIDGVRPQLNA